MAKGYTCELCGDGSLVRSNYRFTSDGRAQCRAVLRCAARVSLQRGGNVLPSAREIGHEMARLARLMDRERKP